MNSDDQKTQEIPDDAQTHKRTDIDNFFFWLLWVLVLILLPFYGFTFLFEVDTIKASNIASKISPIIGFAVFFAQLATSIISFKQRRSKTPLPSSKPYLTLLGSTIIIGLIWVGGCSMMGPLNLH